MNSNEVTLRFLGATGTVTGSKYLIEGYGRRILVDCGLFQGYKQLRLRNWAPLPVTPSSIDTVILTHAHLDHSGYLPLLARGGFSGRVYCTDATRDLCAILLPDSGHLQEEDAYYANLEGFSKHRPALPLYTEDDAKRCLSLLKTVPFAQSIDLGGELRFEFIPAGHILGSAMVALRGPSGSILFSGDLGRPNDPVMRAPASVARADYLVVESTYGDRAHSTEDPLDALAAIVKRTAARGGIVLIPAFAVGRTQTLLYLIHQLKASGRIPNLPVFLNSPMAIDATRIFWEHRGEHRLSEAECEATCRVARFVRSAEESETLNRLRMPAIVIAASGMATGGRVLHHLKAFAPDLRNTVLFSGFQAGGTRGASMLAGASSVRIHGIDVPVRAEVALLDMLSAHADRAEILRWLSGFETPPRRTFMTHGEPAAADALRAHVAQTRKWDCHVPDYLEAQTIEI
ncbi:MAG TPA: MBL fold metallo-hydrolase [Burkholderiales bacterium]|nr:MBL fold metallo-hydrolase [Burkholderiales bacterium]